jgi:hypothetical protein
VVCRLIGRHGHVQRFQDRQGEEQDRFLASVHLFLDRVIG